MYPLYPEWDGISPFAILPHCTTQVGRVWMTGVYWGRDATTQNTWSRAPCSPLLVPWSPLPPGNSFQLPPLQSLASARRLGSSLCERLSSTHPSQKQWPVFSSCQWKIFKSCFFTTLCQLALRLLPGLVLTCKLSTCGSRLALVCWHHLEGLFKQRVLASPTELQIQ